MIIDILKTVMTHEKQNYESEAINKKYEVRFNEEKGEISLFFVELFYNDVDLKTGIIQTSVNETEVEKYSNKSLKDYCNLLVDINRVNKEHNIIGDYV